jgi:hypothetical protein
LNALYTMGLQILLLVAPYFHNGDLKYPILV